MYSTVAANTKINVLNRLGMRLYYFALTDLHFFVCIYFETCFLGMLLIE